MFYIISIAKYFLKKISDKNSCIFLLLYMSKTSDRKDANKLKKLHACLRFVFCDTSKNIDHFYPQFFSTKIENLVTRVRALITHHLFGTQAR